MTATMHSCSFHARCMSCCALENKHGHHEEEDRDNDTDDEIYADGGTDGDSDGEP